MAGGKNANKKDKKAPKKVDLFFSREIIEYPKLKLALSANTPTPLPTQNLQEKTQKKTKSSSSLCPWVFGSILVFAAIGGLLAYDTQRNGGKFEKSAFGKVLKDTGALPYVEVAWTKSLSTSARGYQWAEVNVPVYVNKTCVVLKPYAELAKDLGIIGLNAAHKGWLSTKEYVVAKTPVVVNFVSAPSRV